ncbi:S1C family serine protease [Georgenia faecalis]|uniref:S1C family serine protease n=1 Tax=Georgenia faecalis TaxID=2483799 RepID=A0ABV9D8P7_9MICO|nr:trypsin-like peptidase domain-containing protein [Georgenia faecalis]
MSTDDDRRAAMPPPEPAPGAAGGATPAGGYPAGAPTSGAATSGAPTSGATPTSGAPTGGYAGETPGGAPGYPTPHTGATAGPHGTTAGPGHPGPPPAGPPGGGPPREGRGRPSWPALVGTALAAALLASVATVGIAEVLTDDDPDPVATRDVDDDGSADPVITSSGEGADWASIAAAVGPSTVAIDVETATGAGSGSGVIIDDEGHIVSNHHVVGNAVEGGILVTLADGQLVPASIVGTDAATDLAVIALDEVPDDLASAELGNSDEVYVGEPVAAIGNPLGLSFTVTTGIVSALDRPVTTVEQATTPGARATAVTTNAIQVDAAINPGNSGGPLFDPNGRVIGINSSIASLSSGSGGQGGSIGLGFAIPSNLVRLVADQLIANGVAEHAFLGVSLADAVVEVEGQTRSGAEIQAVEPGTPAAEAGLRPGDVIVSIDDDPVTGAESLTGFVRQHPSGEDVTLGVVRDGDAAEVEVTLATREDAR